MLRLCVFWLLGLVTVPALAAEAKTLRVYFIGNSVTDTINYRGLEALAKSRGHDHVWGRHMIPGAPLQWIWQHQDQGFQQPPFGHFPTALVNYQWDALCLQPFDRHVKGEHGDVEMARNFIKLALSKSPDVQVYVYARWPRKDEDGSLDYRKKWLREYTGGWDGTNETKGYFERLTREMREALPELKKPVLMVPVGHVMFELDRHMKAGEVPGYTEISQVYKDGIHLNNVGSYVVACTFFSTLYGENPKGMTAEPYGVDPKVAEMIHDVAWNVVCKNELTGLRK